MIIMIIVLIIMIIKIVIFKSNEDPDDLFRIHTIKLSRLSCSGGCSD